MTMTNQLQVLRLCLIECKKSYNCLNNSFFTIYNIVNHVRLHRDNREIINNLYVMELGGVILLSKMIRL